MHLPLKITIHQLRLLRPLSLRWQRRIIFGVGGLLVGLAAVVLAVGSDAAQGLFQSLLARWAYAGLIVTPIGFAVAVWITNRFFPGTQGSGIPQAIAARKLKRPRDRARLVGARTAVGKVLMTLFGLAVGASTGREGPTVQVGAIVLLGMVAFFTGVVQAPITGFVIVMEMTDNNAMRLPLMTCGLIASASSKLLCKEGVYHALSHNVLLHTLEKQPPHRRAEDDED